VTPWSRIDNGKSMYLNRRVRFCVVLRFAENLKRCVRTQKSELGRFRSSKGFSQATPNCGVSPRLILLPFGGIPNSPAVSKRILAVRLRLRK
jgi:hypothetical protein